MGGILDFADRALSVPFAEHGRSWDGWDCWGLVRAAYAELYHIELPSYDEAYDSTQERTRLAACITLGRRTKWCNISEGNARAGDVVLLRLGGAECHIGLVLQPELALFLHVQARVGTNVEYWTRSPWRGEKFDKVAGFWRYVGW